jgi:hypothetical protein
MIAEVFPEAYDAVGRRTARPDLRRKGLRATAPMGRYVSQPLTVKCNSLSEIQEFLLTCKYVSDEAQFHKKDYWQPPDEFEKTKKGDCDCFALWTWREFLALGYDARFVVGRAGRYGEGNAWVQFAMDGKHFLVDPVMARIGVCMPRLSTLRYRPRLSVAWDGSRLSYYSHEANKTPPVLKLIPFVLDWLIFWIFVWAMALIPCLLLWPLYLFRRIVSTVVRRPN